MNVKITAGQVDEAVYYAKIAAENGGNETDNRYSIDTHPLVWLAWAICFYDNSPEHSRDALEKIEAAHIKVAKHLGKSAKARGDGKNPYSKSSPCYSVWEDAYNGK